MTPFRRFEATTRAAVANLLRHLGQNAVLLSNSGYQPPSSEHRHPPQLQSFAVHLLHEDKVLVQTSWTDDVHLHLERFVF